MDDTKAVQVLAELREWLVKEIDRLFDEYKNKGSYVGLDRGMSLQNAIIKLDELTAD